MSTRIFGYLPFLAAALGAPAAAQDASDTCPRSNTGESAMTDDAQGRTTVIRSGEGHTATVTRTDPD